MKKYLAFLFVTFFFVGSYAQNLPQAPRKLDFAGVSVKLDADAQKLVQDEIQNQLVPDNQFLKDKIDRIQSYFPIIEAILEQEEVPDDLKYLAIVESSLMPDVVSTSNAVGYWQMKAETAAELGLTINDNVDERRNIYASTRAASLYLKRNNLIYNNWISTLYSYYLGANGVSKAIPADWAYASEIKLDGKTDRYIIKTIAYRLAFEYRLNRLRDTPFAFVEYKNSRGKTLEQIANELNIGIADVKKYNTWLLSTSIPTDKDYSVAIFSHTENVESLQNRIKSGNPLAANENTDVGFPILKKLTVLPTTPDEPIFYQINDKKGILAQANDDANSLAQKGNIKIAKFLDINDMTDKDLVKVGKIYYLEKKDKHAKVPFHTVTTDQTLWDISQMYGITMYRLLKYNRMDAVQRLQTGRILWLQERRPKNKPIEYIIDKEKETPAPKESTPIVEKSTPAPKIPTDKDPDEREISSPVSPAVEEPAKKAPIVVLEDESGKKMPAKTVKKEVVQTKPAPKPQPTPQPALQPTPVAPKAKSNDDIIVLNDSENETVSTPKATSSAPKNVSVPTHSESLHTVVAGETLYSIARTYNIPPRELAAMNLVSIDEKVKIGQVLTVSKAKSVSTPIAAPTRPVSKGSSIETHLVQKGETLFSISKKYGVSMKEIQQWNGMNDQNVKLGQKLIVRK